MDSLARAPSTTRLRVSFDIYLGRAVYLSRRRRTCASRGVSLHRRSDGCKSGNKRRVSTERDPHRGGPVHHDAEVVRLFVVVDEPSGGIDSRFVLDSHPRSRVSSLSDLDDGESPEKPRDTREYTFELSIRPKPFESLDHSVSKFTTEFQTSTKLKQGARGSKGAPDLRRNRRNIHA